SCLCPMQLGCIACPTLSDPYLGAAVACCVASSCSCEGAGACGCGAGQVGPLNFTLDDGCCGLSAECPCGSTPLLGAGSLDQGLTMLRRWRQIVQPIIPGVRDGPGSVNVSNGNLIVRLGTPPAGAFDPVPVLTYNSRAPASSEFGYGWSAIPKC